MFALNLPVADIKISQSQGKPTVYDFLRRRYVALTPEEWVRQQFTRFLTDHKGYPAALMGNEMELTANGKKLLQHHTPHKISHSHKRHEPLLLSCGLRSKVF